MESNNEKLDNMLNGTVSKTCKASLILLGIAIVLVLILFSRQLFSFFDGNQGQPKIVRTVDFNLKNPKVIPPLQKKLAESGNWLLSNAGLCVRPNEQATLILPIKPGNYIKDGQRLGIRLCLCSPFCINTRVSLNAVEKSHQTLGKELFKISRNQSLYYETFDITPFINDLDKNIVLKIEADYSPTIRKVPAVVLRRLDIITGDIRVSQSVPYVLSLLLISLFPLVLFNYSNRKLLFQISTGFILLLFGFLLNAFLPYAPCTKILLIIGSGLIIAAYWVGQNKNRYFVWSILCLILLYGFLLRWNELFSHCGYPIARDAEGYRNFAMNLSSPFDTGFREPFFIWIQKIFQILFGYGPTTSRFVSLFFSVLLCFLTYLLGVTISDKKIGLIAAAIISVNPWLIQMSTWGIRLELLSTLIVCFVILLILTKTKKSIACYTGAGITASLISLTRLTYIFQCFPLLIVFGYFLPRKKWRWAILTSMIPIFLVVSFLYRNYREFDDPMHSSTALFHYFRNMEFYSNINDSSWDGVKMDKPHGGEKEPCFKYVFLRRPLSQVIEYVIRGYHAIFSGYVANTSFFKHMLIVNWIFVFGFFLLLFTQYWYIPINIIYWLGPISFLVGTAHIFYPRVVFHIAPFIALTVALTICFIFEKPKKAWWFDMVIQKIKSKFNKEKSIQTTEKERI